MASRGAEAFKMSPDPVSESKDLQGRRGRQKPTSFRRVRKSWKELQGLNSWQGMVPPEYPFTLDDDLKETLVRYGEFAEATYDAFDWNYITSKRSAGTCKYSMAEMLEEVGLAHSGYEVTDYLYSTVYKWRWPWDHMTHPLPERLTSVDGEVLLEGPAKKLKPTASDGAATLWSLIQLCLGVIFAPLLIPTAVARWVFAQRAVNLFLSFFVPLLTGLMLLPAQLVLGLVPLPNLLAWATEFVVEQIPQTLLVPYTAWIGFVAESGEAASKRLGRRDIVVAWRGTMSAEEWLSDFTDRQVPMQSPVSTLKRIAPVDAALGWLYRRSAVPTARSKHVSEGAQVELGFWNLYTRRSRNRQPGVESARSLSKRAVMARLQRAFGRGEEEVSVTVTGHSLGGALATLSAYDLAQTINRQYPDRHVPVTAFTFASPRVGNSKFKTDFERTPNLRQLRVVNRWDVVPKAPGLLFNENATKLGLAPLLQAMIDALPWTYSHVGQVLEIDTTSWPGSELFQHHDVANFHCLEAYLYMLDNTRDYALVNKWSYYLDDNLGLPWLWWQEKNKCVVKDPGTQRLWQPRRDWDHTAKLINRLPRY